MEKLRRKKLISVGTCLIDIGIYRPEAGPTLVVK